MLVISPVHPDAAVGLLATYDEVVVVTKVTAVLPASLAANGRWHCLTIAHLASLSLEPFDWIALPHGFWQSPAADLQFIGRWLQPGGTVFLGVNGRWSLRRQPGTGWSVAHIARLLQQSGFRLTGTYGIVPNLLQPALIAPPSAMFMERWLAHKVRPAWLGRRFWHWPWWQLLAHFLPAYGFVAQKS